MISLVLRTMELTPVFSAKGNRRVGGISGSGEG